MDGLKVKVTTTDGQSESYSLRPKTLVAFETRALLNCSQKTKNWNISISWHGEQ
jgi:hypothetical protein